MGGVIYMYKNFVSEDLQYLNVNKIFPTKQKDVAVLVNKLKKSKYIKKIIIFGSSITWECNPWSDIDVYIEHEAQDFNNISIPYSEIKSSLDIWDNLSADENLLNEIINKGVIVYES